MKELLIDAIVGKGFSSQAEGCHFVDTGFARFTGNQHNESWGWKRDVLENLSVEALTELYNRKDFKESTKINIARPLSLKMARRGGIASSLNAVYGEHLC